MAFTLVGTRQLRGDSRLPLDAGGAVGSAFRGAGVGAAPRGGGVKLPRADGSGPFLLRLTRPTTSRRRHLRCAVFRSELYYSGVRRIPACRAAPFQTVGISHSECEGRG